MLPNYANNLDRQVIEIARKALNLAQDEMDDLEARIATSTGETRRRLVTVLYKMDQHAASLRDRIGRNDPE